MPKPVGNCGCIFSSPRIIRNFPPVLAGIASTYSSTPPLRQLRVGAPFLFLVILVENGLVPRTKRAAPGAFRVKAEADFQVELL